MNVSLFKRLFKTDQERRQLDPLYQAIVRTARDPRWYRDGQVPDTIEGRFDMVAATLSLVLLRLEHEDDDEVRRGSVLLTETFIDDMEGTLRQIGIGDFVVGKHVGKLVSALGGRLGALREAAASGAFETAVRHNIFHDAPPSEEAVVLVSGRMRRFHEALKGWEGAAILAGDLPSP